MLLKFLESIKKNHFYPRQIGAFTDRLIYRGKLFPLILSSSVVERSAVNRFVVGSNPTWGDCKLIRKKVDFSNKKN